jgi:hypothetical protein
MTMGIRQRLARTAVGLTILAGTVAGTTTVASAATQTCAQLQAKVDKLWTQYNHVANDEARQKLLDQIDAVIAQMEAQNCFASTVRTFAGTARVWTDSSQASGQYDTPVSFPITFRPTGEVGWSLPTLTLSSGITVSQQSGRSGSGSWHDGGYLSLTAPISVNTPLGSGSATLTLTTDTTVGTRVGPVSGSRISSAADWRGSATVVGAAPVTISIATITAQAEIFGTLS